MRDGESCRPRVELAAIVAASGIIACQSVLIEERPGRGFKRATQPGVHAEHRVGLVAGSQPCQP